MSVKPVANSIQQTIPPQAQMTQKFSISIPQIAKNLNTLVLPLIVTYALSSIPGAEAGPVCYAVCVSGCLALVNPILTPGCLISCIALSGPWCP